MSGLPTFGDIEQAAERITPYVHRTPVLTSHTLDEMVGCRLYFKCENLQRSGAFKMRGAVNALLNLTSGQRQQGVVTHSSGNHAGALALASSQLGIDCHVVMPTDAPACKKQAVKNYGAQIIFCEPGMESREASTRRFMDSHDAVLIHPYDNFHVICGQGSVAIELLDQVDGLDAVILPVGGGGLIAGCALVIREKSPDTLVYGVEPEGLDEARHSLESGIRQPATGVKTLADGLQGGIGQLNFDILRQSPCQLLSVSEQEIVQAMRLIWERMKLIVEPSSAVPLAAILGGHIRNLPDQVGIVLTGGNVDLDRF